MVICSWQHSNIRTIVAGSIDQSRAPLCILIGLCLLNRQRLTNLCHKVGFSQIFKRHWCTSIFNVYQIHSLTLFPVGFQQIHNDVESAVQLYRWRSSVGNLTCSVHVWPQWGQQVISIPKTGNRQYINKTKKI